jgi:hypothetical protein
MRHAGRILAGAVLASFVGAAAPGSEGPPVVACETLVGLRLLMGDGVTDHASAVARLPRHPVCRLVARARVGSAEHRAMVGGAPFECRAIRDEGLCAWVMP